MPSNKQQLEKGMGREGDSVAHRREEREEERAWALMRSSLNLKKGANEAPCHQTDRGDEGRVRTNGLWVLGTHKGLTLCASAVLPEAWVTGIGK